MGLAREIRSLLGRLVAWFRSRPGPRLAFLGRLGSMLAFGVDLYGLGRRADLILDLLERGLLVVQGGHSAREGRVHIRQLLLLRLDLLGHP
eukprot:2103145-Rhodomonas_salina.1